MPRLTYTERIGLAKEVLKFLESHRTELMNIGINPTKMIQDLKNKIEANVAANNAQEKLKASLYRSTDKVVAADRDMYVGTCT
jgi:ribosome recycling factor